MLFWQRTTGYIERLFPANYTQAACDGFNNTAEKLRNGTSQERSFKFEIYHSGREAWETAVVYPLNGSRLGFDFAIYGLGSRAALMALVVTDFRSLCQSKTTCIQSLHSTKTIDMRRQDRLVR